MIDSASAAFRLATVADAALLTALSAAAFTETFGHLYPPEDLRGFLAASHSEAAWERALKDPHRAVWIASLVDGVPVGFLSVGACKLPVENLEPTAGEIQQLYVLAKHHNLRLGSRLMEHGLDWLQAEGRAPLYVGVWLENQGAQRFYARYGFAKVGEYGFVVGKTVDREFILRRDAPTPRS
ncbi:MAG: GNAT family N-acetyltransferase [Steroidobacteraceae bacterium]